MEIQVDFSIQLFFAEGIDEVVVAIKDDSCNLKFRCNVYVPINFDLDEAQKSVKYMEDSFYATYGKV